MLLLTSLLLLTLYVSFSIYIVEFNFLENEIFLLFHTLVLSLIHYRVNIIDNYSAEISTKQICFPYTFNYQTITLNFFNGKNYHFKIELIFFNTSIACTNTSMLVCFTLF